MASAGCAKRTQSARPSIRMEPGVLDLLLPYHLLTIPYHPYHLLTISLPLLNPPQVVRVTRRAVRQTLFFSIFFPTRFLLTKIPPKWSKNSSKIDQKSGKNRVRIACTILHTFLHRFLLFFCMSRILANLDFRAPVRA